MFGRTGGTGPAAVVVAVAMATQLVPRTHALDKTQTANLQKTAEHVRQRDENEISGKK